MTSPRSTDPAAPTPRRALTAAVAALTALALVLVAPTVAGAQEAGPQIVVEPATDLDPAGQDVVVTGTGFPTDAPGLYVLYGPEVTADTDTVDSAPYQVVSWVRPEQISDDGSFTVTLEGVTAAYTDGDGRDRDFGDGGGFISTFRAHGVPDPTGAWRTSVPVTFAAPDLPASTTTLTASSTSVRVGDGVVLTAHVRDEGGANVTDGTVELRAGDAVLGSSPLGGNGRATVTTSFPTPGTRQVTARFSGNDDVAPSASDAVAIAVTAATPPPDDPDDPPAAPDLSPSGTRTGRGQAGQTVTATPVDNIDPAGTEVTVTGAGFTPAAGFDIATDGLYLGFCVDRGPGVAPSPCVGGVDMSGASSTSRWISNDPYPGVQDVVSVAPDGTWRTTITIQARDDLVDCLDGRDRCVLATRMDHRASGDRSQDVKVPICFAGEAECAVEPISTDPSSGPAPFSGYALDPLAAPGGWAGRPSTLAATGSVTWGLTATGIGLATVGLALVSLSRRRRDADLAAVPAVPTPRPSRTTPGDPS